ncbi:MAG: BON domain-containing protein [Gemmatimonadales bacterium]|nr:BON domain-containing protein [Gemmatimonadales bacterium]NIN13156.1 BON domain-containing protein [Gemmatimonadales bacterium]NIN51434.1 BON domain-containing protein [Gemmatimonadales bacterium]NIP08898.1 BON domain-containing protein [Gemmatimonadales bacterium]NIR03686.1 BON domain-containing protein [Gemmatimonadales bacterium]
MAIITLSREAYSGVTNLAERLSEELGYRLLSREDLLADAAKEFGALQSQLESALIHRPGFLEGRGLKRLHYVHCVRAAMAKAVQADDLVYHGEAGHLLLKGIPHHLRVRVLANVEYRIEAVMEQCDLTREKAIEYITQLDEERNNWVQWVHGVDMNDPATYDLVINLEHIPVPSAASLVAQMAARDFRTTPQSQKTVDDLVLASEIRARIGLDRSISDDKIEVDAKDGVITITVNMRYLADADKVKQLASQIPGVKDIQSQIVRGR